MKSNNGFRKYVPSMLLFLLFEAVAATLWLTKNNLFYLLNFSYIGACLGLGTALFTAGKRYARHFVQLAVGSYMLLYLGVISRENMQIEGFWYYLFLGVFEAATIHYAVAKIFGPLLFGRGWCGYACWTAMVLPLFSGRLASWIPAQTAAPEEIPTSTPSLWPTSLPVAKASSFSTVMISS